MGLKFKSFEFEMLDDRIVLKSFYGIGANENVNLYNHCNISEVHIAGGIRNDSTGAKQNYSSEWHHLKYICHEYSYNTFIITQRSTKVEVKTYFQAYENTNAIRVYSEVKNITNEHFILEHVSVLNVLGIANLKDSEDTFLYRFTNSHQSECQPRKLSFDELGLFEAHPNRTFKRIFGCNTGSWSSKEELPQAIIERADGKFLMFQIESNNSWYWEIGEVINSLYLNLGGPNNRFNQWSKKLEPNESYKTINISLSMGNSLNEVVSNMTNYRRNIIRLNESDSSQPIIFNEYMHMSWDSPEQKRTEKLIPEVAKLGVDYYVIDCGWHNEEPGNIIYPYVGQWKESKTRFPLGIKYIVDLIEKNGMKAGLWLEPEIIGYLCEEMINYYPSDAYLIRNGKPIIELGRRFLDFRCQSVIDYLNFQLENLINYGVKYFKFDYNQDCGAGTEYNSISLGDGLEQQSKAYLKWIESLMNKYPDIIFETCSSGGQRMDYQTLSLFPIVSSSDQIDYKKYPAISSNIFSAVIPTQAAVWSYPVHSKGDIGGFSGEDETIEDVDLRISDEAIIMNMVNSMLGRMHLASRVHKLSEIKKGYIKEGINYYKSLNKVREKGLPIFPLGFANFKSEYTATGLFLNDKIYLAVWNLNNSAAFEINLPDFNIQSVKVAYPSNKDCDIDYTKNKIRLVMLPYVARMLEIDVVPILHNKIIN